MKSIQINQQHRETIAHALTVQAVQQAAGQLKARIEALNADYWERHIERVEKLLGRPRGDFDKLAQAGLLRTRMAVEPEILFADGEERWASPLSISIPEYIHRLLTDPDLALAGRDCFLGTPRMGGRAVRLWFRHSKPVPELNHMEKIEHVGAVNELQAIAADAKRLIAAARDFHKRTMAILRACRTSRQLEDVFPEAAKLLPKPAEKKGQMVPQDQINAVRDMLTAGVAV